jgi:hypothetical protein
MASTESKEPVTEDKWCPLVPKYPYKPGITDIKITCAEKATIGFSKFIVAPLNTLFWDNAIKRGECEMQEHASIVCTALAWMAHNKGLHPGKWLKAVVSHDWGINKQEWTTGLCGFAYSYMPRSLTVALFDLMLSNNGLNLKMTPAITNFMLDADASPTFKLVVRKWVEPPVDGGIYDAEVDLAYACAAWSFIDHEMKGGDVAETSGGSRTPRLIALSTLCANMNIRSSTKRIWHWPR